MAGAVGAVALLAGCDLSGDEEVRRWMTEQRQEMRPAVVPLPEPKRFVPRPYAGRDGPDPFDPARSVVALERQQKSRAGASAIKPDLDRPRDPLEKYPLEQIRMVGYMLSKGRSIALVDAGSGTTEVRVGQYLGQNFGRVSSISETEIVLKEIVQDSSGDWVEREAKLELQAGADRAPPPAGGKR